MIDFGATREGAARILRASVTFHRLSHGPAPTALDAPSHRSDYCLVHITPPMLMRDGTIGFLALWERQP